MSNSREEHIRGDDGHEFTGYLSLPDSGSGPGMVVIQEIFGVTDYIKGVCARLNALGYVALAPDLYSRIDGESVIDERSENALPRAFGSMQKLDMAQAARDSASAVEHLRTVSEVSDRSRRHHRVLPRRRHGVSRRGRIRSRRCRLLLRLGDSRAISTRRPTCTARCSSSSVTPTSTSPPSSELRSSRPSQGRSAYRVSSPSRPQPRLRQSQRGDVSPPGGRSRGLEGDHRVPGT